jgi:hypothetical protein
MLQYGLKVHNVLHVEMIEYGQRVEGWTMTDRTVTLTISETVYDRARRIAENAAQPVERVLASGLEKAFDELSVLPPDEQAELAAFRHLTDDTLRGIVREQMTLQEKERMVYLGDRTSRGTITPEEAAEYVALVERGNRLMLRKAWAADVLMGRGHKIAQQDYASQDD